MVHQDRISKLPNDILLLIISRLTLKEATSTSILSTSWRHVHTQLDVINFPKYRFGIDKKSNYVSMIDCVLNSRRGSEVKELEVDMFGHDGGNFERWFEFAMTKKVERVRLVMYYDSPFVRLPYTLSPHGLECLKDLYLSHVQMTDQDFELLISNCVALERLTLRLSFKLEHVSIVGLSNLKHLNLCYLLCARSLVIRDAINLISLTIHNLETLCTV